jgi:hypothetical protein
MHGRTDILAKIEPLIRELRAEYIEATERPKSAA